MQFSIQWTVISSYQFMWLAFFIIVGAAAVKKQPSGILQCQQSLDNVFTISDSLISNKKTSV